MANPATSMEFLQRKAEELKKKGVGRLQGTHLVPGTKSRIKTTSDDTPARKKLKQDMEDRVVKVARRRLNVEVEEQVEVEVEEQNVEQSSRETLQELQNAAQGVKMFLLKDFLKSLLLH